MFVDDEPMVLQGLQRMLRGMRNEWDMMFVESGTKALELMKDFSFDVVVSDMRMPGMNGAELLCEVLKRSPKSVRLILSGHADQDLILKCVGSTHQYLSKPCEPETLRTAITRALELEKSLQSQTLRQLASQMETLPSIPALYIEIVEKMRDPNVGLDEVAAVMERDIAMTAKILKLSNSAFFGLSRPMSSPLEAVRYIGLETIKALVLSVQAFSQFEKMIMPNFSIEALWAHSQATGALAQRITRLEDAKQLQSEAFVAGLLHDTGRLVLASNFPVKYGEAIRMSTVSGVPLIEAERIVFGANHAEVGGYLLGLWGLPTPVVEAITFHHCPAKAPLKTFSTVTAVHVANGILHDLEAEAIIPHASLDMTYLSGLGLTEHLEGWRAAAVVNQEPELLKV
jgi:HD-like signal output (HDOD) protein/CheY-like chemotaxis protein